LRRETLFRLLYFLTTRAGSKRIGQRVLVLAYLAGATSLRTQKQLGAKLGVSAGRVSQILNSAKCEFAKLAKSD
jgi:DNA-directed RNA polymerase specialized sigma subunit